MKNKNWIAQKNRSSESVEAVREKEVKQRREGFVKKVGFKLGVKSEEVMDARIRIR